MNNEAQRNDDSDDIRKFYSIIFSLVYSLNFRRIGCLYFTNINALQKLKSNGSLTGSNLPTPPLGQDMTQGQFLSGV